MLTSEHMARIDASVLCWLSTSTLSGEPNVSPKEIFAVWGVDTVLTANIASPQSAKNIRSNPRVCVSLIDILVQKGVQLFGTAVVVRESDSEFDEQAAPLRLLNEGKFPFSTLFKVKLDQVKDIIAPRYRFFPETTEQDQSVDAIKTYKLGRAYPS